MTAPKTPPAARRDFRQEEEHIDRGWSVITAAVLLPFLIVLAVAARVCFVHASRPDAAQGVPTRPEPGGEVSSVHSELFERPLAGERLKAQQQKTLAGYAWVDRQHGVVRVPIDTAIELVAKGVKEQP
jgi:hypothetical protein